MTSMFYNTFYADSDLPEWDYNEYFIKFYSDRANLYAQMVKEGREKEFEWLRDWLLQNNPYKGHVRLPQLVTAKKPNIYLYPEKETDLKLSFDKAEGITASIPCYSDSWLCRMEQLLIPTVKNTVIFSMNVSQIGAYSIRIVDLW